MENKQTFNFSKKEIPNFKEQVDKQNGYYRLGNNNKYYDYLEELYKDSSNHSSMVDNQIDRIIGSGFQSSIPLEQEKIDKYGVNEWLRGVSRDLVIYGGMSTEIIWTQLHEYINSFYKVNIDRIRVGLFEPGEDESTLYFYSPYFSDYSYQKRNKEIEVLYKFDIDPKTDNHQILYNYGKNRIGEDIYPRPDYSAGIPWIITDAQLPKYYMNLVHNNFMVSQILVVPYQPNQEEREDFEKGLKNKFCSPDNAGSTLVVYSPSDGAEVKLLNVAGDQGEKKYDELINLCVESISRSHRIPSSMLCGLSMPGNLFGISDLPFLELMYNKQVIYPKRNLILNDFKKINENLREPIVDFTITDLNVFNEKTN